MNGTNFLTDYLVSSLHLSIPLAFAALGGLWSERSGVLNIGLEGMLLSGAFISAAIAVATGSAWLGILGAIALGALVGLLHAFLCVTLKADQVVSGLAINLAAAGLTSFWARILFASGEASQLPAIEPLQIPWLGQIPLLGRAIFQQDTLFYLLLLLVGLSTYTLFHTSIGLSLRSVGEAPRAADTAGISVALVRYGAVIFCGALAGLGGAYLTLVHVKFFAEGMSAGKGFIALAALIFGRWHPAGAVLACLLFGATEALQLRIQAFNLDIPYQFLVMLPYAIALLALVGLAGKSTPPAALGTPYLPEEK